MDNVGNLLNTLQEHQRMHGNSTYSMPKAMEGPPDMNLSKSWWAFDQER
jgi:hypothetical protein